jgi:hypothetical protein
MLEYRPESMYLMHFSRVTDVARLGEWLKRQVLELAALARTHAGAADPAPGIRAGMLDLWLAAARRHGCRQSGAELAALLAGDLELNTLGLLAWLQREAQH